LSPHVDFLQHQAVSVLLWLRRQWLGMLRQMMLMLLIKFITITRKLRMVRNGRRAWAYSVATQTLLRTTIDQNSVGTFVPINFVVAPEVDIFPSVLPLEIPYKK